MRKTRKNCTYPFTLVGERAPALESWPCCLTGEGNGTPLQYSCLENPMDGEAWKAAVHGVAEGRTRLSPHTATKTQHSQINKYIF